MDAEPLLLHTLWSWTTTGWTFDYDFQTTHSTTWYLMSEPVKGRILHVRIHGISKGCDIINVYQHIHNIHRLDARAEIWHALHELLASLPKRNSLFLAGDMNTSLHKRCTAVGLATFENDKNRQWVRCTEIQTIFTIYFMYMV